MCFDICAINIRVSIRVRGLHLVCFSVWGSFPCYLLHFGAKISDLCAICCILEPISDLRAICFILELSGLRAICCVFELKSLIVHAICSISELKSQIGVANIINLHDNCNILVFTHFPMVFNDVWMVLIAFLIVFNDLSGVSKIL